jgi:hypothetical protein
MKVKLRFHSPQHKARPDPAGGPAKVPSKRLAGWLAGKLQERGVPVTFVEPGEFGCLTICVTAPFPLCMGCSHAEGTEGDWQCEIEGDPGLFQKLFHQVDPSPEICHLKAVLADILGREPEITEVSWDDEPPHETP